MKNQSAKANLFKKEEEKRAKKMQKKVKVRSPSQKEKELLQESQKE